MSEQAPDPGQTSAELEAAVDASHDDAKRKPPKIFQVGEDIQMILPDKWKRAKFMKAMHNGDLWAAFASIWPDVPVYETDDDGNPVLDDEGQKIPVLDRDGDPETETHPELAKLEEVDMTEDEFQLLLERLGETLMGRKKPKGKGSGR